METIQGLHILWLALVAGFLLLRISMFNKYMTIYHKLKSRTSEDLELYEYSKTLLAPYAGFLGIIIVELALILTSYLK